MEEPFRLSIKNWAEDDRPREKMSKHGPASLSDAELIAILLGSGTRNLSAVELARKVLELAGNNVSELGRKTVAELIKLPGIGEAKAITLMAALELGRRRKIGDYPEKPGVTSSRDAFEIIHSDLADINHEEFWVIFLNRANKLIRKQKISQGGISGTVTDNRVILRLALEHQASSLILSHNHPSGNLTASQADIQITHKLKEAAKLLELEVIDHIIVAGNRYLSFADEGLL
jgi:DNA repair protein RadC